MTYFGPAFEVVRRGGFPRESVSRCQTMPVLLRILALLRANNAFSARLPLPAD
jgi:hypothetical protein